MVGKSIQTPNRLPMGDTAPQPDAQELRDVLVGLPRFEQHRVAIQWAKQHDCVIDMFGSFAREHQLLLFQSGNESENWISPSTNIVYKMNMLVHVGEDILKLLDRITLYNHLFPEVALRLVGFHAMGEDGVFSDGRYLLRDIKPKNVLASEDGLAIFVIDADVFLV